MENEWKITNRTEKSLEKRDYSKEYWYLNNLKWIINFDIFNNPTLTEHNFYSSIARYIDLTQKAKSNEREEYTSKFIDEIKQFNWENEYEKIKKIDIYLTEKAIKWYKENWYWSNAWILERSLKNIEFLYKKDEKWKIKRTFSWIINSEIPERYYWRLRESWLWNRILKENKIAFARTIREQKEKADELKDKL